MARVSAFTVVKDAIRQGYPFAESIASMLPVCDELLVSDGYSTDGTYEILEKIEGLNSKVRVYQQEWTEKRITIITELSNALRKKCRFEYLLYIQAPEIIHENCVELLRALPEMFPDADTFNLPFMTLIGNLKVQEESRLRFCRNVDRLSLTGDAWAFSVTKPFVRSEARRSLRHPRKLLSYIGRGVEWAYASSLNHMRSRAIWLPTPILRYPCLSKENYIERCSAHEVAINVELYRNASQRYANVEGKAFFEKVAEWYKELNHINYVRSLRVIKPEEHPAVIKEFVEKNMPIPRYYVRDSVLDMIAHA